MSPKQSTQLPSLLRHIFRGPETFHLYSLRVHTLSCYFTLHYQHNFQSGVVIASREAGYSACFHYLPQSNLSNLSHYYFYHS